LLSQLLASAYTCLPMIGAEDMASVIERGPFQFQATIRKKRQGFP
jgi:hypothetical protein